MLQNHDRPGWPARRSAAMRSSPNRGPNGFLARYSRQLPSHDVELHLLNFGGYFLPLMLRRDPFLRGLGLSTRVELVLYASITEIPAKPNGAPAPAALRQPKLGKLCTSELAHPTRTSCSSRLLSRNGLRARDRVGCRAGQVRGALLDRLRNGRKGRR
jgi:hypothetical protein